MWTSFVDRKWPSIWTGPDRVDGAGRGRRVQVPLRAPILAFRDEVIGFFFATWDIRHLRHRSGGRPGRPLTRLAG
jgi:hypothetical protein